MGQRAACLRSAAAVLGEYEQLLGQGVSNFYFEYDPYPASGEYYRQLFDAMARGGARPGINFGAWTLPGRELVASLARAVSPRHSSICVSPDTGSPGLRRRIKGGPPYENKQLEAWCLEVKQSGILPTVAFTMGLPFETAHDFEQTLALIRRLKRTGAQVVAGSYKLEPGSPIYRDPGRFGVTPYRRCFEDYYQHTRALALGQPTPHPLGYRTAAFTERQILELQFRALRACYLSPGFLLRKAAQGGPSSGSGGVKMLGSMLTGSHALLQRAMRE